jgi:hypothetical protein
MTRRLLLATMTAAATLPVFAGQAALPRTLDGHPDLQGVWDYATITPFERPKAFANKKVFTKAEAEAFSRGTANRNFDDLPKLEQQVNADIVGDLASLEQGPLDPSLRTSLIVEPPDGKMPLTPNAKARMAARAKAKKVPPDGPEALSLSTRCLPDVAGPPLLPVAFNSYVQIVQTADYLVIETEMIHDARIIPLDARAHLPRSIREWNGDSRGRWNGDTLIIDTTNFPMKNAMPESTDALHVVEHLTRTGERALLYEFTVTDRAAFTRPWSAAYTFRRTDALMYEFACHEGNYSIVGMLKGARAQESGIKN